MKTKNSEIKSAKYKHGLYDIQLGVDGTDHVAFFCPDCNRVMKVIEVISRNIAVTTDGKTKDNCTWIYLVCDNCKRLGQRKFYWSEETGEYCWQKTNKKKGEEKINSKLKELVNSKEEYDLLEKEEDK